MAYIAIVFAALWLGTCLWWRYDAARKSQESDEDLSAFEDDRDKAIAAAIATEKVVADLQRQVEVAAQTRAEAVEEAERLKADNQQLTKSNSDLSIENAALTVQSEKLHKTIADQRLENVAVHEDLDACSARMVALLGRLRDNLHAKKPAPWKALAARLLQEHSGG